MRKAFIIRQGIGISQAAYFNWKKKYAGLMPSRSRCVGSRNKHAAEASHDDVQNFSRNWLRRWWPHDWIGWSLRCEPATEEEATMDEDSTKDLGQVPHR